MNILITSNKNVQFLSKIYYFIFLIITLSVLTSLIFANSFYQKTVIMKNISIDTSEKNLAPFYIDDLHTVKSLQKNELIHDFRIDNVRETKIIPNIIIAQLPRDLKTIKSIKTNLCNRLLSQNKEKWLTLYDAYKKIDDLREKCDNENDYISMQSLNEINKYLETIEYKLQEN